MPLVVSDAIVLSPAEAPLHADSPLFGWHNIVTTANIAATYADASYPITNVANPQTHSYWLATSTALQYVTITTGYAEEIDYVAVADHNLATAEVAIEIGYFVDNSPEEWVTLVQEVMLPNDGPAVFRFTPQVRENVKIKLAAGSDEPRIAVVYCGKLLVGERRLYEGHAPLPHARKTSVVNNMSESGKYLGSHVLGAWRATTIELKNLSPDWVRDYLDEFLEFASERNPFFFVWRPETYPLECGYCWATDDPTPPTPSSPNNLLTFSMRVSGVV